MQTWLFYGHAPKESLFFIHKPIFLEKGLQFTKKRL